MDRKRLMKPPFLIEEQERKIGGTDTNKIQPVPAVRACTVRLRLEREKGGLI